MTDFYDEYSEKYLGAHYKVPGGEEHHIRVGRLKLNWYAANITKYAERAELKGQLQKDIRKIIDYAQMWLDQISPAEPTPGYVDQAKDKL